MTTRGWTVGLLVALRALSSGARLLVSQAHDAGLAPSSSRPAALVFEDVTVVDVQDGRLHPEQTVVVAGTRITAVGSVHTVRVPAGAQVVDARGKYLIPGLWDMHIHVMGFPEVFYPLLIANGITGIRDMGTPIPLDTVHRWQREVARGTRVGPRQLNAGNPVDNRSGATCASYYRVQKRFCPVPEHLAFHVAAETPARARYVVDSLQAAGADFIKVYNPSRDAYFALLAEARRVGIPAAGHLPDGVTHEEAIDSGQRTFEHDGGNGICWGDSATLARCAALAERLRQHHAWEITGPGPTPSSDILSACELRARLRYWPDSVTRKMWLEDSTPEGLTSYRPPPPPSGKPGMFQLMQQAGLPILAGTDGVAMALQVLVPGFALQEQVMAMAERGLTPLTALQTATLNPALHLRGTDSLGTVAAGKLADLVLLDANPLDDLRHLRRIRAVVANGRYFDRAALDALLSGVEQRGAPHWARHCVAGAH